MRSKSNINFICENCGFVTKKWFGNCPECKEWNTFTENTQINNNNTKNLSTVELKNLSDVSTKSKTRMLSGIKEWDKVLGEGIVPGSFLMVTGDPGIGKSTLLLQVAHALSQKHKLFYFSSEESLSQVKSRAIRLNCEDTEILFSDKTNLDEIILTLTKEKPKIVIIDSIQNCFTTQTHLMPGSIGQLKEAAFKLMRLAKELDVAIILTGHITKDGFMAGPKTLEHMVDAVFYLQGEDRWQTRILRSVKNRFGPVNELAFFEMHENGLFELPNINQQLLKEIFRSTGSVLTSSLEGTRPFLIELQALTIQSKFGIPQRVVSGTDQKQAVLISAILEKYLKVKLSNHDIFIKISGGLKIKETSSDLALALALLSSYYQKLLPEKSLALGEINLTGQIKPINFIDTHLKEAEKFGIEELFIAKNQKIKSTKCKIHRLNNVYELLNLF